MEDDHPLRGRAEELIAACGHRTPTDDDRLAEALRARCWPGGPADRTEPVARGWVRRWRPRTIAIAAFECTCAQGRCALCN
jgi:hypothetical protein